MNAKCISNIILTGGYAIFPNESVAMVIHSL